MVNNPAYSGMDLFTPAEEDFYGEGEEGEVLSSARSEMRDMERLLLRALEYDHTADSDADAYKALGVVYNVSKDYDAAASAFRRYIVVQPEDYQLRNKLGATLANGDRSEKSLTSF